jgi:hypothetical protein
MAGGGGDGAGGEGWGKGISGDFGERKWTGPGGGRSYLLVTGRCGAGRRTIRDGRSGFDLAAVCCRRFLNRKKQLEIFSSPGKACALCLSLSLS